MEIIASIFDPKSIGYGIFNSILSVGGLVAIIVFLSKKFNTLNESVDGLKTEFHDHKIDYEKTKALHDHRLSEAERDLEKLTSTIKNL